MVFRESRGGRRIGGVTASTIAVLVFRSSSTGGFGISLSIPVGYGDRMHARISVAHVQLVSVLRVEGERIAAMPAAQRRTRC